MIQLSKPVGSDTSVRAKPLYVSETEISKDIYGEDIFNDFLKRHGLEAGGEDHIVVIRSTIMNAFFTELTNDTNYVESSNNIFISELLENCCNVLISEGLRKEEEECKGSYPEPRDYDYE